MSGDDGRPLIESSGRYAEATAAIDAANAGDPTVVAVRGEQWPLAQVHGRLAAAWAERLLDGGGAVPAEREAVLLAARAHHLRRWDLPRASYPEGRAGYLRWRRDQKRRHAEAVDGLLADAGYPAEAIERVQSLVRRDGLAAGDAGAQVVEDAACLVFLETQLAGFAARTDPQVLVGVVRKTAAKMSPAGVAMIADVPLSPADRQLLGAVLA